jgi:hypothetical protein
MKGKVKMIKITINNNGVMKEIEVPETVIGSVEKADKMLLFAEWLGEFIKTIKANCTDCVINNGGSEHFNIVSASESKKVNWEAIKQELNIAESLIAKWTTYTTRKAYLKVKKSLNFF